MSLKVFYFWLAGINLCGIVSILANASLPTADDCDKNYTEFCKLRYCMNFYTNNTIHREFIELSTQNTTDLFLEFYVVGYSDCHVHLSPIINPNQTHYGLYDFLIGGFNNTRTVVRHGRKILRDLKTANVLSESQPVQIRIETSPSGDITIYRNRAFLMSVYDRQLMPVRYVSFSTDHQNGMIFYYNCLNIESSAQRTQYQKTYPIIVALVFVLVTFFF